MPAVVAAVAAMVTVTMATVMVTMPVAMTPAGAVHVAWRAIISTVTDDWHRALHHDGRLMDHYRRLHDHRCRITVTVTAARTDGN